jgi:hypothetical protein
VIDRRVLLYTEGVHGSGKRSSVNEP